VTVDGAQVRQDARWASSIAVLARAPEGVRCRRIVDDMCNNACCRLVATVAMSITRVAARRTVYGGAGRGGIPWLSLDCSTVCGPGR
jgi:hypothetical protein